MDITISLYDLGLFVIFCVIVLVGVLFSMTLLKLMRLLKKAEAVIDDNRENIRKTVAGLPETVENVNDTVASVKHTVAQVGGVVENFTDGIVDKSENVIEETAHHVFAVVQALTQVVRLVQGFFSK